MPEYLGRYFTIAEFERTSTGLPNEAPAAAVRRMGLLVAHVLDPLRLELGCPVRVTSGFRTAAVNLAIKGSRTSQHMVGEAADIDVAGIGAEALAAVIVVLGLRCDQVIWYDPERGGHVHVSYTEQRANRGETMHAPAAGGYLPWWQGREQA